MSANSTPVVKVINRVAHLAALAIDRCRRLDFLTKIESAQVGLDPSRAFRSSPSGDRYLRRVLNHLQIKNGDQILDVGCGKGSAMRCMLRFPFSQVDGIELSSTIAAIAEKNFARLGSQRTHVFAIDAIDFPNYGNYEFIYFYNPFPSFVMDAVMRSIGASVMNQKEITLIYNNPTCHNDVVRAGFQLLHTFPDRWGNGIAIYSSCPPETATRLRQSAI
jgi:SAM-dependent methyltransferase